MTTSKSRIVPNLWFDRDAKDAVELYCSLFPHSRILSEVKLHDTPSGDTDIITFELSGQAFMAINAGPTFKLNPSISFIVNIDPSKDKNTHATIDGIWARLADDGKVFMPLQEYPFSKRYGWVEDRFGLSWQLILSDPSGDERPLITPSLMFTGKQAGHAEEAIDFYLSIFKDAKMGALHRYPKGMEPDEEGTIQFADFMLENTWLAAVDSGLQHEFSFNEAMSLIVNCATQDEVDFYWEKLSAVPESEQCGWLKDKYGVSWQIVPTALDEMLSSGTREQIDRVMQAFMPMKKLIISDLEDAFQGSR